MHVQVYCYSGYRGEETPKSIKMGEEVIEVEKVLDRWLAPDHRYFKFLGKDKSLYIIRHDTTSLEWELTFYRHSKAPQGVYVIDNCDRKI